MSNRVSRLLLAVIVVMSSAVGAVYWWQHVAAGGSPPTVTVGPVATPVRSDSGVPARVSGRIVDAGSREPIADAVVRLEPYGFDIVSDDAGRFEFVDVPVPPDRCPRVDLVVARAGLGLRVTEMYLRPGNNSAGDVPLRSAGKASDSTFDPAERVERPSCARGGRR